MGTRICIMNGGRIAQVGPPLEVYRQPANTFVASFLGNPPMNLLSAVATDQTSGRSLRIGASEFEIGAARCPALRPGKAVIFGIRPEHVLLVPPAHRDSIAVETEVVRVEPLGAETIAILKLSGIDNLVFARLGGDAILAVGERKTLYLDSRMAHVFDDTGTAMQPLEQR